MTDATNSGFPPEAVSDRDAFVRRLADAFCTALRDELTEDTIKEVNDVNAARGLDGPCATHDFCDANMPMLEATRAVAPDWDFEPSDQRQVEIWVDAWDLAKQSGFAQEERPAHGM